MSVITHTRSTEVHLDNLPTVIQDAFDKVWDDAETAAENRELTSYALLHAQAADLIGIQLPTGGELARCTCQTCYCTCIFDAAQARTYQDGTVEFVQCPRCADEHRHTEDE